MNEQLRLGRVAGIEVGVNWSVLVIFTLLSYLLSVEVLPASVKHQTAGRYWATGLLVAVFFFGSLLAHEIAHAIVARRFGVRVRSITLWMLGGVTRLEGQPETARQHLMIAVVGPVVSFGAAMVFGMAAYVLDLAVAPQLLVAGMAWLAGTNVLLGVFNLLPGAPLDGGRVLQAFLWMRGGDRDAAATRAARFGTGLGSVLVGLGLFLALFTAESFDGIWLVLIGWFLMSASAAEERAARTRRGLRGVHVRDVMTTDLVPLPCYLRVDEVLGRVAYGRQETFPVVDLDGTFVGLVTADVLARMPAESRAQRTVRDASLPWSQVPRARPEDELGNVVDRLSEAPAIAVLDEGHLVGLVTLHDVRWALRRAELQVAREEPMVSASTK